MTPQQMADWLEGRMRDNPGTLRLYFHIAEIDTMVSLLRAQPTDAQKIEALKEARYAGECFSAVMRSGLPSKADYAKWSARAVRRAMRLLGLNPEGV